MNGAVGDMLVALFRSGKLHAVRAPHQPAIHHGVRDLRMELQSVAASVTKRLDLEDPLALGQKLAARGQIKPFPVPLVHMVGPVATNAQTGGGRTNGIIADLGMALRMREDARAEVAR